MNKEFKKNFFMCLLVVLLVISNLIGLKFTSFLSLTIGVDFITFPFTFLCTLLLYNMGGKKSAYQGIVIASLIQIFVTISYTLAVKLGTQTQVPDLANSVNAIFKVNEIKILGSIFAFLLSNYVLIYIYENFKNYGKELFGVAIGLLGSLVLNCVIFLLITLSNNDPIFVINMILSNIIISIIMVVVITILYYILKEKDTEVVSIKNMNIDICNHKNQDTSIEELIVEKKKVKKSNANNTKKVSKPRKNTNTNSLKKENNSKNTKKTTNNKSKIVKKNEKK